MKNIILEKLNNLGNDVDFNEYNGVIEIDFNDFCGFDEDWNEVLRDYDNPSMVSELLDFLSNNCKEVVNDFYTTYIFNDFQVIVGYASYDI